MPASSLVRAAFFALGAAVGGGTVAVLNASKKKEAPSLSTSLEPAVTAVGIPKLPVVDVGVAGEPRFFAGVATAGGPILKYGNPGTHATAGFWIYSLAAGGDRCLRRPHFGPICAHSVCDRV
jgi:endonuclease G, mitochondrial